MRTATGISILGVESLGCESDVAEDPLAGDTGGVKRIGPELHKLLHDVDAFEVGILGRIAFAESPMAEGPVAQGTVGVKIAAHLCLPSGDEAGKQMLLAGFAECVQFLFHGRADEGGSVFDGSSNSGTVEAHLGRKPGGFGTPVRATARIGNLLPVRGFDVVWIGQQILALSPGNGIINVKGNGHIVFLGYGKSIVDELTRLGVGHVETEGPHSEGEFIPGVSCDSDCVDDVVNEPSKLCLSEREVASRRAKLAGIPI